MNKLVFFNNKGGVGKTTMVYHLSWMFAELGHKVLAVDLDPQSNLSSMFLDIDRLAETMEEGSGLNILDALSPIAEGEGYQGVHLEQINEHIGLVIGNLALSLYEDKFSDAWLKCLDGDIYAFKVISAFQTLIEDAARRMGAAIVLIDVGPNLGAINRTSLISSDWVILPVAPDLFSIQGIKNLGKTLTKWKTDWAKRKEAYTKGDFSMIPKGEVAPAGYVIMQYSAKERRPVKSYMRWADRIPEVYAEYILQQQAAIPQVETDPNCLGLLKHYHSLAPMSMEARKPIFLLKPADGAIGAHSQAVRNVYHDFRGLTQKIISTCRLTEQVTL